MTGVQTCALPISSSAFELIKEEIAKKGDKNVSKGKIVVCTVKGDIHDIGKNIVKVILENYGYRMIDLGRDAVCHGSLPNERPRAPPFCPGVQSVGLAHRSVT